MQPGLQSKPAQEKLYLITLLLFCWALTSSVKAQNLIYAKGIKSNIILGGNVESRSIKADQAGNTYVTGSFSGTADFDPGADTANITSAGDNDIFIAKYDASGHYVYAKSIGGPRADAGNSLAIDISGNVYITGYFGGTADFDPGAGTANLTSKGYRDIFIGKI